MITNTDLNTLKLSPTNKDYYQIWNELLDVAKKLSLRWDPTSTNESDPGIVLLKVITAIADKINYNIDKNILEAFMPTAAQRESMQKLCDMMGYSMKYYRSATTNVTFSYIAGGTISRTLPRFTSITDTDGLINYITTAEAILSENATDVPCIEGSIVLCTTDNNALITMRQLDDNNRYYLPENQIAENGIFIYNVVNDLDSGDAWEAVQNVNYDDFVGLNTAVTSLSSIQTGSKVYKFGYDSRVSRPYIQFPSDIDSIIGDGLHIYYVRTAGVNGNTAARTLTSLVSTEAGATGEAEEDTPLSELFHITNNAAAVNGTDPESLTSAYENFKKTIGTFNTLVTCRDYMNYIYSYENPSTSDPVVSNIIVSDIRSDINRATTICTFNNFGISYINKSIQQLTQNENTGEYEPVDRINHFDLIFYPYTTVYGRNSETEYVNSFNYTEENLELITDSITSAKTISHVVKTPAIHDVIGIRNYLQLNARVTTISKVNLAEEKIILNNIKTAIYKTFNMRRLDFGEEIPFDLIQDCIQNADTHIKNVSLDEPELITVATVRIKASDSSDALVSKDYELSTMCDLYSPEGGAIRKLLLNNILAGRVSLFNYDTTFNTTFDENIYGTGVQTIDCSNIKPGFTIKKDYIYTQDTDTTFSSVADYMGKYIKNESTGEWILVDDNTPAALITVGTTKAYTREAPEGFKPEVTLAKNEFVTFRAPSLITKITYPAYVYYFLHLEQDRENIEKDTEYQLRENEYLVLQYTQTNKDETKSTRTIAYNAGTIIKPNFIIQNSSQNTSTLVKKLESNTIYAEDGRSYSVEAGTTASSAAASPRYGLFAFGAEEQVEIRDTATVELKDSPTYLYWILNDTTQPLCSTNSSYTLQDGEYLFYTDKNKLDLAYYGAGTEIITYNVELGAIPTQELSIDDILERGVSAVPWQQRAYNSDNYVIINEFQYITLGENDILKSITFDQSVSEDDKKSIDNTWKKVSAAEYTFVDEETSGNLPTIEVSSVGWEVRGRFVLNTSDNNSQLLHYNAYNETTETIAPGFIAYDQLDVTERVSAEIISFKSSSSRITGIKTNLPLTITVDTADFTNIEETRNTKLFLRAFEHSQATVTYGSGSSSDIKALSGNLLHNLGDHWTTITGQSQENYDLSEIILHTPIIRSTVQVNGARVAVDSNQEKQCFGLITIYTTGPITVSVAGSAGAGCKTYNSDLAEEYQPSKSITIPEALKDIGVSTCIILNNKCRTVTIRPTGGSALSSKLSIVFSDISIVNCDIAEAEFKAIAEWSPTEAEDYLDTFIKITDVNNNHHYIKVMNSNLQALGRDHAIIIDPQGTTTTPAYKYVVAMSPNYSADACGINIALFNHYIYDPETNSRKLTAISQDLQYLFAERLLNDIKTYSGEDFFYYNCIVANDSALNIGNGSTETLCTPRIWYDYNNKNNNFVISEIDASYLDTGIQIAKSSKLNK